MAWYIGCDGKAPTGRHKLERNVLTAALKFQTASYEDGED